MNWIFEIYGDTYKALSIGPPHLPSAPQGETAKQASLPLLHPLAFLFRR